MVVVHTIALFFLLTATACNIGTDGEIAGETESGVTIPIGETIQSGVASWYGPGFHGRRTSSGETYDQHDSTAAHRTLPFGTVVRVVNEETGASVEVRINDRGPYARNRIIDLSRAAAEKLEMMDSGVAEVRLELIDAADSVPDDLDQEFYTIQVGEYSSPQFAEPLAEQIGGLVRVEEVQMFNRTRVMVYYGHYESIHNAREDLQALEERGFEGFVKQIN